MRDTTVACDTIEIEYFIGVARGFNAIPDGSHTKKSPCLRTRSCLKMAVKGTAKYEYKSVQHGTLTVNPDTFRRLVLLDDSYRKQLAQLSKTQLLILDCLSITLTGWDER